MKKTLTFMEKVQREQDLKEMKGQIKLFFIALGVLAVVLAGLYWAAI